MANVEAAHCRRRLSPCRLGAGASRPRRAAGGDHRRQLRADNPPGGTPSSACRSAGASSSPPPIDGSVYAKHGTTIETR
jgi:hypothetical protein